MRHAKSSWENGHIPDFDRPLNDRGLKNAPFMGSVISKLIKTPQIVISSPAKRAITTAEIISEFLHFDPKKIIQDERIYHAVVSDIMRIIYSINDDIDSIMLFGHNPTFTLLSNYLSDKHIENLPTSGFVHIDFNLNSWKEIEGNTGKLILFEYPKKYLNN